MTEYMWFLALRSVHILNVAMWIGLGLSILTFIIYQALINTNEKGDFTSDRAVIEQNMIHHSGMRKVTHVLVVLTIACALINFFTPPVEVLKEWLGDSPYARHIK